MQQPRDLGPIVLTGASSGLGAALAVGFAGPGVSLGLIARRGDALEAVAEECRAKGARVRVAAQDVRDAAAMAELVHRWDAEEAIGTVVANAGTSAGTMPGGGLEGAELAIRQVTVNLLGAMHLIEPLIPAMRARRRGQIAMVASVAALRALPDQPAYTASKAGLYGYGEALRPLLRPDGIRVTTILPGFFPSGMSSRWRGGKPMEVSLEKAEQLVRRAILARRRRLVFPWPMGLLLRGMEILPAPLADLASLQFRFAVQPPITVAADGSVIEGSVAEPGASAGKAPPR